MTRVWAPAAHQVDVVLTATGERRPLARVGGGWWDGATLEPGSDYAFSLDGGPLRPDPRSRWQPDGVHGPSRVLDPASWTWTDDGWSGVDVRGRVLYELHVGTFTPGGTLDSAIEHLDDLVALGVDVVELMPLAAFDGPRGWGYDGVAISAVHEPYGGPDALHRFVDAAHARGLGVCLDVVHNHLGPSGNYLAEFGPYFTDAHHTPWGAAVNLDQDGADEVRRWICDSALGWLRDFHLDALRLDAVHALVDGSPRHLLAQLSDEVAALSSELGRPLSLVAESDLNDPTTIAPTPDGLGMTAQWADDVHHAIHALVTGERHGYYVDFGTPQVLRTALTGAFVHAGTWSTFRGRTWGGLVPPGTDGHGFVVAASNHDQVGNRALGDRPSARLAPGQLAVEAALVLLSPFTPMLFMGEEWGASTPWQYFTSYPDAELGAAVSRGRRAEFGGHGWRELYGADVEVPDPQSPDTFRRSVLDRSETTAEPHARVLDWYRRLVALRRSVPDLASGDLTLTDLRWGDGVDEGPFDGWLVVHRGAARVVVNLSDAARDVRVDVDGPLDLAEAWEPVTVTVDDDGVLVGLGPRSVAVLVPPSA